MEIWLPPSSAQSYAALREAGFSDKNIDGYNEKVRDGYEMYKESQEIGEHVHSFIRCIKNGGVEEWKKWRKEHNVFRPRLQWIILNNWDLRRVDLSWANLTGANFRDADLRNSDLSEAKLSQADFTNTDLRGADTDYIAFDLTTKFHGAQFDNDSNILSQWTEMWQDYQRERSLAAPVEPRIIYTGAVDSNRKRH